MEKEKLSYKTSLDEIKIRIKKSFSNPNIGETFQIELKSGPIAYKIATIFQVLDPNTKQTHHYYLRIDSINREKEKGWFSKPDKSIIISDDGSKELTKLKTFLQTNLEENYKNNEILHVVRQEDFKKLEMLLNELPNLSSSDQLQLIKTILNNIKSEEVNSSKLIELFEGQNNKVLTQLGSVAKLLACKNELSTLKEHIALATIKERQMQDFLKNNPWMFGSEYSELLVQRKLTRDTEQDFVLQRSSDGFLEIIEIKLPITDDLMLFDTSHKSYYPSAKLSVAIGQVMKYIEDVDRDRDSIIAKDEVDTLKIRAKIIIGRSKQCYDKSLRNLNYHLNRIEIITYDQLVKISERVIGVFEEENKQKNEHDPVDDLPF